MKKSLSMLLILTMVSLIVFGGFGSMIFAQTMDWDEFRIAGADRYETAYEIGKISNPNPETVLIVRGDNNEEGMPQIIDGLTASVLAGAVDAPILLVGHNEVPAETLTALQEIDPNEAWIIGGTMAISATVEQEIEDLGILTKRVAGQNRFDTAAKIAMELEVVTGNIGIITNGNNENLVDSLVAGPLALQGHPILLVNNQRGEIPEETLDAIDELGIEELIIIGGTGAVSQAIEDELNDLTGVSVLTRLAGRNRYETSVKVAEFGAFDGMDIAYLVNGYGTGFVDAVAASTLGAPILYFNRAWEEIPVVVVNHLRTLDRFMAIGGYLVATDAIMERAYQVTGHPLIMPTAQVVFGMNIINSENWLPESEVEIEIERNDEVIFTHDATADAGGNISFYMDSLDTNYEFTGGDLLSMTDNDERAVEYEILYIHVMEVDVETNTVSGHADANQEVEVYIDTGDMGDAYDEFPRVMVDANADGEWTADFTGQIDMWEGLYGGAMVSDEEGNSSIEYWDSNVPHISVYPHENNVSGYGWQDGVTITVNGTVTYTIETRDGWFNFLHDGEDEVVIAAGDEIVATDGDTTYSFEVAELEITGVNRTTGDISGTAAANSEVMLSISTPIMQEGGGRPTPVADENLMTNDQGEWSYSHNGEIGKDDNIYVKVLDEVLEELVETVDRDLGAYSSQ